MSSGVAHWRRQRLTAAALAALAVWLAWWLASLGQAPSYRGWRTALASPLSAAASATLVIVMFWHIRLGLESIIVDYIHQPWLNRLALWAASAYCGGFALLGLAALAMIVWGPPP